MRNMNKPIKEKKYALYIALPILTIVAVIIAVCFGVILADSFDSALPVILSISIAGGLFLFTAIYSIWFFVKMVSDINIICEGDGERTTGYIAASLLALITCGIYYIYYIYRIQTRLHENADRYEVKITESGVHVVLWMVFGIWLFGFGFIFSHSIICRSFNKLVRKYNEIYAGEFEFEDSNRASQFSNNENNQYAIGTDSEHTVAMNESTSEFNGAVRCLRGSYANCDFDFGTPGMVVIGREASECNIILDKTAEKVSRKHCIIKYDALLRVYMVIDCSRNGTFLSSGQRLENGVVTRVAPGEILSLGDESNSFELL